MKERNHSQLKDQDNSPERTNSETDLFSLTDTDFKKDNENTKGIKEKLSVEKESIVKRE